VRRGVDADAINIFESYQLIDTEIYKALEPHGIAHAKRFISRETGPEVNLDTFLITYNMLNIKQSKAKIYNE
jgi:hypothetical protein